MGKLHRRLRTLSVGPRHRATGVLRNGAELLSDSAWRSRLVHPTQDGRPDLRDADFRGCSLEDLDLGGCRLDRSVFDGVLLNGTDFRNSDLSGASFVESAMEDAKFDAVRALDARFDRALLNGSTLVAANLAFTSFRHASLDGADLRSATFFSADLRNASFKATARSQTDFEEADTTCVVDGGEMRPSVWTAFARECGAASFAGALRHYMPMMGINGPGAETGLRAIEAAIEHSQDLQLELRGLLTSRLGWRVQLIGGCALMLGGAEAQTVDALWSVVGNSWVSPQLVVAASRCDPRFVERAPHVMADASVPAKCRGAIAAALLTWFRDSIDSYVARTATALGSTAREGFAVAPRWATRFEAMTEPLS